MNYHEVECNSGEQVAEQSYSIHDSLEQRKSEKMGGNPNSPFKGTPQMTYFLKPCPIS
jgi:hypothetical protein